MEELKIVKSPKDFVKWNRYSFKEDLVGQVFEFSHLDDEGDPCFFDGGKGIYSSDSRGFVPFLFEGVTWVEVS